MWARMWAWLETHLPDLTAVFDGDTGHNPIPDHCGIPEHNYCSMCQKSTPREASR